MRLPAEKLRAPASCSVSNMLVPLQRRTEAEQAARKAAKKAKAKTSAKKKGKDKRPKK